MVEKTDIHEQLRAELTKAETSNRLLNSKDSNNSIPDMDGEVEKRELQRQAAFGNQFQGDVGEGIAERVASDKLGLTPDPRFDKSKGGHGIDSVFLEGKNRLVVIEAKCDERGIEALRGDQMQPEWVKRNIELMKDPDNERFTQGNAEIAHDVLHIGVDNVRRIVIITNPITLEVKVYEGQEDRTWKEISNGKWDAFDLEQPYLK
jgi:hypothetical protein